MTSRRTDWIIGLLVSLVMFFATNSGALRSLEHWAYDLGQRLAFRKPAHPGVVVVAIDDASIDALGPWPWSRDVLARVQRKLSAGQPKLVAYDLSFEAPHNKRGLKIMGDFRNENDALMDRNLRRLFQEAVNDLDTDYALASSFRGAGNIILQMPFELGEQQDDVSLSPRLLEHALSDKLPEKIGQFQAWPGFLHPAEDIIIERLFPPTSKISASNVSIALSSSVPNRDGSRAFPLVFRYGQRWLPSLPVSIAAYAKNLNLSSIAVDSKGWVSLGQVSFITDNAARVYPSFYKDLGEQSAIPIYSFADIDQDKISSDVFAQRIVLIGLTASRFVHLQPTPLGIDMPPVLIAAHNTSSLLEGDVYKLNETAYIARYCIFILIALYLIFLLPRLRFSTGLVLSLLLLGSIFVGQLFFMLFQALWVPLMSVATLLVCGHVLTALKGAVNVQFTAYQGQLSETNRMLGQTLQSQGQLDQAFDKFKKCAATEEILGLLYNLGLDYERKRQFNKAAQTFKHIAEKRRDYKDIQARLKKNDELANVVILGKDSNPGGATLIITHDGVQKPVLGRYEVEKELGRGAMGMVYLGRDPRIGREVAIKTMSFSDEFDADSVQEVKERFFREAEAAGRLKHPNIVTVYDVGEEEDLCYIAMDFLKGKDLSNYTAAEKLLSTDAVLDVTLQVVDALHYAHQNNVVHRDVKPGNIIYDIEAGRAVVTDFGVASLTDNTKTRTGTILGSPAYMSPEQLAGHRVDGRSDLFSMGVTMFQLLTGELPFKGDSLSNLMYQITHEKHPDVRKFNSELPPCVSTIINRALNKDSDKRFKDGESMIASLKRCRERLLEG